MSVVDPGAAAGAAGLALAGILALFDCDCKKEPPPEVDDTGMKDSEIEAALAASDQAAKDAADRMAADAAERDGLVKDVLNTQETQLAAQANKIKDEMAAYNKQWQDAQQGMDPKDPGYDAFKKQYDDYQDYLKGQLDGVNSKIADVQATRMQEQIAQESKNDWIKQRQEDLVQTAEQKSYLEAVAKGYGSQKGYDIAEVNARLKQLNEREAELKNTLKANNADIEYTPQQRDPIGPDADSVRLNDEYRAKKMALEKEIADAKAARDEARSTELEKEQAWLEKDMKAQANKAAFWNVMTKGAEATQVVADTGVDILSNVTGPAGKTIKGIYQVGKGVGGGFGEGLANGDMGKNIFKGTVGGVSDVIKDKIGDKYGKAAQGIYNIGAESGKGALGAGLDGKSIVDGAISAGIKGGIDTTLSAGLDKLLPPGEMPAGMDWTNANTKDIIKSIKGGNPLTSLTRGAVKDGFIGAGKDQIKNLAKGDEIPVLGFKQGFTDAAIEASTPFIKSTVKDALTDPGLSRMG